MKAENPKSPPPPFDECLKTLQRNSSKAHSSVSEGIIVTKTAFHYDKALGETLDELAKNKEVQLTVPAVIQRNRILVTRPHFKQWKLEFTVDAEDDIVNISQLQQWLEIGGRRVGIGAWRPTKSGYYGRFRLISLEERKEKNE